MSVFWDVPSASEPKPEQAAEPREDEKASQGMCWGRAHSKRPLTAKAPTELIAERQDIRKRHCVHQAGQGEQETLHCPAATNTQGQLTLSAAGRARSDNHEDWDSHTLGLSHPWNNNYKKPYNTQCTLQASPRTLAQSYYVKRGLDEGMRMKQRHFCSVINSR